MEACPLDDLARELAQKTVFRRATVRAALEAGVPARLIEVASGLGERDGCTVLSALADILRPRVRAEKLRALELRKLKL
jgi:hypothetical protein